MEQALYDRIYGIQRDTSRVGRSPTETRPMTMDQARAAWQRIALGINVPGANDEGLVGWPGISLSTFFLTNGIELVEGDE